MKKIILEIGIDDDKNEFTIQDNFKDFPLKDMNAIIGLMSNLLHNQMHTLGSKQLEYNEKMAKQN